MEQRDPGRSFEAWKVALSNLNDSFGVGFGSETGHMLSFQFEEPDYQ